MKVAFDASALKPQYNHHGIQVYTRNLLAALHRIAGPSGIEIRPFLPAAEDSSVAGITAETRFSSAQICSNAIRSAMALRRRNRRCFP